MNGTPPPGTGGPSAPRRLLTGPLVPVLAMASAAAALAPFLPVLSWAITGGLGGYALSGSV
ncbi:MULTISPECIES: hypothetical protein [unclassified Streptomyces]|uniref:hypothetical protein n=1 Tax=unclassified Streptomyces TaxID=2593676 RepID=UPI000CD5160A|nr:MULTISPECIES: hypothetical protein [unclassified Streptomyces]